MKVKILFAGTLMVGALLLSSCASKKDLVACQTENQSLSANYTQTKEQLAVANSRISSLEEQLATSKAAYAALQASLDKSLSNQNQASVNIDKLVDQIN